MNRLSKSVLALILCTGLVACTGTLEAPPVEVAYRDSLVGIGKIVRITNVSEQALTDLEVRIENPNGDVKNRPGGRARRRRNARARVEEARWLRSGESGRRVSSAREGVRVALPGGALEASPPQ